MKYRIAFFDSGVGGFIFGHSLVNACYEEIATFLNNGYDIELVYICDNKNAPYHSKTFDEILNIGNANLIFLANESADINFISCNTISSQLNLLTIPTDLKNYHFLIDRSTSAIIDIAKNIIQERYKKIHLYPESINISILATNRTIENNIYQKTIPDLWKNEAFGNVKLNLHFLGLKWSEYIQKDFENNNRIMQEIAELELSKLIAKNNFKTNTDLICLYCTHFPFYINMIENIFLTKFYKKPIIISQGALFQNEIKSGLKSKLNKITSEDRLKKPSSKTNDIVKGNFKIKVVTTGPQKNINPSLICNLHKQHCDTFEIVEL